MATNGNDFKPKISHKFYCKFCDYGTSKKSNYVVHLSSTKHYKNNILATKISQNKPFLSSNKIACENCEKCFNDRSGLWRHKKKCVEPEENKKSDNIVTNELLCLITELVKSNTCVQNTMMELCKQQIMTQSNNTTTHINSHNKSFNLQFFLNETCKDAMNIMDFANSIKVQLTDLETVGELGYVEGISNIIVKNLNSLDVTKRPIHCTDKKREVLYVKDEDKWEKEDKENNKVRRVIKKVAYKNSSLLKDYREKNPDYKNGNSKMSDKYDKLVIEVMGGKGDNDAEKQDKIIRNISRVVSIEKMAE